MRERKVATMIRSLVVAFAAISVQGPAMADGRLPPSPGHLDPLCAVGANLMPWDASTNSPQSGPTSTYRLVLTSQKPGSVLDAHITLVDDSGLYLARIRNGALAGAAYQQQTQPFLVTFPKPVTAQYVFVSAYYVDDSPQVACPTEISYVRPASGKAALSAPAVGSIIVATFAKPLPALPCGNVYTDPRIVKNAAHAPNLNVYSDPVTDVHYRGDAREDSSEVLNIEYREQTDVVVFLDINGAVVDTYLQRSTNLPYEKEALTASQTSTYAPATFLCQPTVGSYLFQATYKQ
jgi:hypothetical protein